MKTNDDDHIKIHVSHSSDSRTYRFDFFFILKETKPKFSYWNKMKKNKEKKAENVCIIVVDSKKLWLFIFGYWFWQKKHNKNLNV